MEKLHDRHRLSLLRQLPIYIWILFSVYQGVLSEEQQSFRRRPKDLQVKLGETANFNCEIENQVGPAQWTKDGFALGYEKEIPGFDGRYFMEGEHGVHNLRILNVSLSDIAEFQCQVGPRNGNQAIRSNAHLDVIVAPTWIEILNYPSDATLTLKEKMDTELECMVGESRPAPTIVWYRNGMVIPTDHNENKTKSSGFGTGMKTTSHKLRISPTSEDDNSRYICEARHPALGLEESLKTTLNVRVQYPPGAPRITGYTEGDLVHENQLLTLTCISRGGNPLAELVWFKDDVRIQPSSRSGTHHMANKEARHELTFPVSRFDNGARFRCEAYNSMTVRPKIADVVLGVVFPPEQVKLSGPSEARIGETLTLTCVTSLSNPKAEIAWFRGGQPMEDYKTTTAAQPSEGGSGWITSSNVTFIVEKKETFTCQAVTLRVTKSEGHVVKVVEPPNAPVIHTESRNLTIGQMHKIVCISTGGFPHAGLIWYRDGVKIDADYSVEGNYAKSELLLEGNVADNGVTFKCEAMNRALLHPLATTVVFSIIFPPSTVKISTHPEILKDGEKGYLTCESGSSNPPADVTFYKDSQPFRPNFVRTMKQGEHGGMKTAVTIDLDLTPELDGLMFTCEAGNSATEIRVQDSLTLDVYYKPQIEPSYLKMTATEGQPFEITLLAKANPPSVNYKWSRNGFELTSSSNSTDLTTRGPSLNFALLNRSEKGLYSCEISNSIGTTTVIVQLDIKYSPKLTTQPAVLVLSQGETATFECLIDADPLNESMVEWRYKNSHLERKITFNDKKSTLEILNVTIDDAGEYFCFVNNGIGETVNQSVYLLVKHKPILDESPRLAKASANKGTAGILTCRATGTPDVVFTWNREDSEIVDDTRFSVQNRKINPGTFESTFEVQNTQPSDYGLYKCTARNDFGSSEHLVKFGPPTAPDSPLNLRVANFTHDSVTLSWEPSFDGGLEQTFRIQYYEHRSDYKHVIEAGTNTTVVVQPLALQTEYLFSVLAVNSLGKSNWTCEVWQGTLGLATHSIQTYKPSPHFSHIVITSFILLAITMLLLNLVLLGCFIKRRQRKREREREDPSSLSQFGKPDLLRIVVISICAIGAVLLLVNVAIISYFIRKKNVQRDNDPKEDFRDEASDQGSSKSATVEMYAPGSYTETGESSLSEKSYGDHDYIDGKSPLDSAYLVDPGYPYHRNGMMQSQSLEEEVLRRNTYQHDRGQSSLGRRTPSRPAQNPSMSDLYHAQSGHYYPPPPPLGFGPPTSNSNSVNNGNRQLSPDQSYPQIQNPPSHLSTFVNPRNLEYEGYLV